MSDELLYRYDAFISNSPQDREWVKSMLLPRLHEAGLRVDLTLPVDKLDASARDHIVKRIAVARYVIAMLSSESLTNNQTLFEWQVALDRNYAERRYCLLPVKIGGFDERLLPKEIAALTIVDFTQPTKFEKALAYLLSVWQ